MLDFCWVIVRNVGTTLIKGTLVNCAVGVVDAGVTLNLFCFDVTVVDSFLLHLLGVPELVGPLEAWCAGPVLEYCWGSGVDD